MKKKCTHRNLSVESTVTNFPSMLAYSAGVFVDARQSAMLKGYYFTPALQATNIIHEQKPFGTNVLTRD